MIRSILTVLLLAAASASLAADGKPVLLSTWSTDCDNQKTARWFALEQHGEDEYMFIFCYGFKCIRLPGFWEPFDVYDDPRVRWLSESSMEVSNDDKDAGWDGYIEFHRCMSYQG